jgi:arginase family enzyme
MPSRSTAMAWTLRDARYQRSAARRLRFEEAADLLTGLARRGRVAGINFAEDYPSLDLNGITALGIVRLIVNVVGVMG